jgi:hypothetical protein
MMLVPVRSEHIGAAWPLAEPFIRAACQRGPLPCDAEDLREACEQGVNQLWIVERNEEQVAAAVTGIRSDDRTCIWLAMGGDYYAAARFMPQIEDWAKDHGCLAMRSFSRPGMVKRFPAAYRVKGVIFEKDLRHGR